MLMLHGSSYQAALHATTYFFCLFFIIFKVVGVSVMGYKK